GGREVGAETADRGDLRAAVVALGGEAGEAGNRFSDAVVGELADVFGSDRFHHGFGVLLFRGGAAQRGAEAGDDDRVLRRRGVAGGLRISGRVRGRRQRLS